MKKGIAILWAFLATISNAQNAWDCEDMARALSENQFLYIQIMEPCTDKVHTQQSLDYFKKHPYPYTQDNYTCLYAENILFAQIKWDNHTSTRQMPYFFGKAPSQASSKTKEANLIQQTWNTLMIIKKTQHSYSDRLKTMFDNNSKLKKVPSPEEHQFKTFYPGPTHNNLKQSMRNRLFVVANQNYMCAFKVEDEQFKYLLVAEK